MEFEPDFSLEREDFFTIRNLPAISPRSSIPLFGGARRANETDLRRYLSPFESEDDDTVLNDVSLLVENDDGKSLRGLFKRQLYIPADIRRRNMLVVGQIGSGKTEEIITPMLVSDIIQPSSIACVDFKGDVEHKLGSIIRAHRNKANVFVINFSNGSRTTHAWNPYSENLDSHSVLEDAQSFCEASQTREKNSDSQFWDGSAARWIAALMFRLRSEYGKVCPADIYEALESQRADLLALLKNGGKVPFAQAVASFQESGSHNAETVLATAQMYFRIFENKQLAATTSVGQFTFDMLLKKPSILILEVEQRDVERIRPLLNLFFSQLFREAMSYAETQPGSRLPIPLNVYMDDFAAALGRIPGLGGHLNMARSSNIRVVAATQTVSQIKHFYGTESDSVVSGFSSYILKSPASLQDAEWASQLSGTGTVEATNTVQNLAPNGTWETVSRTINLTGRRVLLPEEIRLPPEHFLYGRASTVILPDVPVFQAWFRRAYDTPGLAEPIALAKLKPRKKSLRRKPLVWQSYKAETAVPRSEAFKFTDTRTMSEAQIRERLEIVKATLQWSEAIGSPAGDWWQAFEKDNDIRSPLILRLAEELSQRKPIATIAEFFESVRESGSENIQAVLLFLDFSRLKKEEKKRKRQHQEHMREVRQRTPELQKEFEWTGDSDSGFVRCKACKSLIPKTSTKCRICGTPRGF